MNISYWKILFIDYLIFSVLVFIADINCHGEEATTKLLLISFTKDIPNDIINVIQSKYPYIHLPIQLDPYKISSKYDSTINGCYSKNSPKCDPIWVKVQKSHLDSAILNWPNQTVFNHTWPTFSFGCKMNVISKHLLLERMIRWISKKNTVLGIMSTNLNTRKNITKFTNLFSSLIQHNNINIILISMNSNPKFLAVGPNFKKQIKSVFSLKFVDIYLIIYNILQLRDHIVYTDANVTLPSLLVEKQISHVDISMSVFITVFIAVSVVISCVNIIWSVKNRCGKAQKINHQYNLGLKNTSANSAFPEHAFLLHVSDEDELYTDALPHIQTSNFH